MPGMLRCEGLLLSSFPVLSDECAYGDVLLVGDAWLLMLLRRCCDAAMGRWLGGLDCGCAVNVTGGVIGKELASLLAP